MIISVKDELNSVYKICDKLDYHELGFSSVYSSTTEKTRELCETMLIEFVCFLMVHLGEKSRIADYIDSVFSFKLTKKDLKAILDKTNFIDDTSTISSVPLIVKLFVRADNIMFVSPLQETSISDSLLSVYQNIAKSAMDGKGDASDETKTGQIPKLVSDYLHNLRTYIDTHLIPEVVRTSTYKTDNENLVESKKVDSPFEELNSLTGLASIKKDVMQLVSFIQVQQARKLRNMKEVPVSLHLVFTGNPGTGKTTVARILADIYKKIGILKTGQLVEVDRSDLVAGYVGQTALKTQAKVEEAMGGILFIDEAYTLSKDGNDFGQEAIDTLLKAMEDYRDKFIVIVAGYPAQMETFINSNPGLRSRFNKYLLFEDYSADELIEIFNHMCTQNDYIIASDASDIIEKHIHKMVTEKDEHFANARDIRNMFERIITNQAARISISSKMIDEEFALITKEDLWF